MDYSLQGLYDEIKDAQDGIASMRPEDAMFHMANAETILTELMFELRIGE